MNPRYPFPIPGIAMAGLLLASCTTVVQPIMMESGIGERVWPAPPAEPRIAYLQSFATPDDLGIRKSLTQRLGELISGPSEIRLVRPMAVAVAPDGTIYVADPGVEGVHRFDRQRGRYKLIRGVDGSPLPSPVGLAVGLVGEVYVTDSQLARVFMIEPGSSIAVGVSLEGLLDQPTGITLDPASGRLYLVDTGSHKVKVYSRDGALLRSFGNRGAGDGEFNFPTMISRNPTGEYLITDSMNFRIQVYDENGRFLRKFGDLGNTSGQHAQPKGIAVDSGGHIYVVDSRFHVMQLFDNLGIFLLHVGGQGRGVGEFWLPTGIFIDDQDRIYVADSYNQRIQVFRYLGAGQ